ncbi:hypothetical protein [Ammoniphilus sp. CFH 90114]|uniref:hypothetical protein n=1 Tax=Ammoniphilus sp. CFH 90114 TaxID=2493665 RepID=UPI00100E63EF|nr:hypothetical protein [Ammoniphilus sp. CFH 90114]RXT04109.1 hypothetical protein EIZ39_21250 [Ammoniphilus sp. CFH 90114]
MMNHLEYNMKVWDKKRRKAQAQTIIAGLVFVGLLVGIGVNATMIFSPTHSFPTFKFGVLAGITLIFLLLSLSTWTNYSFLYHYFTSQWMYTRQPESLELLTGTIDSMDSVRMPYIGSFRRIQLRLQDGDTITLYIKPELIRGVQPSERIRVLTFHMFAVEVTF